MADKMASNGEIIERLAREVERNKAAAEIEALKARIAELEAQLAEKS